MAVLSPPHAKMALEALAHYHGAWWRFLRHGSADGDGSGFTPSEAIASCSLKRCPRIMFMNTLQKTFSSVGQLLRNRGESEEFVQRWLRYGREGAPAAVEKIWEGNKRNSKYIRSLQFYPCRTKILF